ncbi:MAG: chemotaxis protein MotB, partial [Paracoccaceae bacterium]
DLGASETSLSELEQQLANITADLTTEEKARLAEEAAALALQKRLADTENALTEEEKTRLVEAAAAEALRKKLEGATAELTAMTLTLEEQRRAAEDTLTLLAAADVARKQVDDFLAAALLAQTNAETAGADAEARIAVLVSDKDALDDRLAAVIAQLEATGDESSSLLADAVTTREDLETRLATALAAKLAAEQDAGVVLSKSEQRRILLAEANKSLSDEKARSAESLREIALLNQQTATLRKQLNALQALLDLAKAKDVEANVQLESLGANLNTALAQVAAEQKRLAREQTLRAELEEAERKRLELEAKDLEKFKSEFFGQMRELLGDREGVRIVGDRFVFSSEILFPAGSTDLALEGQAAIAKVAGVIRDVADKIPSDIDWILRVDGHTDNVPLSGNGIYQDNWQLSQARALSVVRYLIEDLDMPADRLAATGFGEFQPLNSANTPTARAQNRRIELKFTER